MQTAPMINANVVEGFTRWYRLLLSRGDEDDDGENGLRMERRRGWVGVDGAAGIVEFEIRYFILCMKLLSRLFQ